MRLKHSSIVALLWLELACAGHKPQTQASAAPQTPTMNALQFSTDHLRVMRPTHRRPKKSSPKEFMQWKSRAISLFKTTLQVPAPTTAKLAIEVLQTTSYKKYERQKIAYTLQPGFRINAYLYLPKESQDHQAAILIWHGHSEGGKEAVAGNAPFLESKDLHRAAAAKLAEEGYVVLAPDLRSFGESGSWYEHRILCGSMLIHGQNLVGQMVADGLRGIDLLAQHAQVDASRIAVGGFGFGAQIAVYQAILDPRVKAVIAQAFLMSFKHAFLRSQHDVCQYIPSLAQKFSLADITAMLAPRPTLYVNGHNDLMFPMNDVNFVYEQTYKVYRSLGAAENVLLHRHPHANYWVHNAAQNWMEKVFSD